MLQTPWLVQTAGVDNQRKAGLARVQSAPVKVPRARGPKSICTRVSIASPPTPPSNSGSCAGRTGERTPLGGWPRRSPVRFIRSAPSCCYGDRVEIDCVSSSCPYRIILPGCDRHPAPAAGPDPARWSRFRPTENGLGCTAASRKITSIRITPRQARCEDSNPPANPVAVAAGLARQGTSDLRHSH